MTDCIQWNTEPEGLGSIRLQFQGKVEFLAMRFSDVSVMRGLLAENGDESNTGLEACLNVAKSLNPQQMEKVHANKLVMYKAVLSRGKMLLLPPGYMLGVRAHGVNPHGIASLRASVLPAVQTAVQDMEALMAAAPNKIDKATIQAMKDIATGGACGGLRQ